MTLSLYNTLTRRIEPFTPANPKNIRIYVCGPTVYDRAHLGNARSVVVYDVLYRLLCHIYGAEQVTYVRNITDVDDKINAAAKANNEPIFALTQRVTEWFHADMTALSVLPPTVEPRATKHIPQMVAMIQALLDKGYAYASEGHVLFSVASYPAYGALSGRRTDELQAGARVSVESYKRDAGDFVLWKPAAEEDDVSSIFDSPFGRGRPGWHIECSAMAGEYLGQSFDLHGGGADLMFPHHENEIAQSCCAGGSEHAPLPPDAFARHWMHNGFLTVNGEKMSKSLGNFITVHNALEQGVKGEVIRYALLSTQYSNPLDWNEKLVQDARKNLDYYYKALGRFALEEGSQHIPAEMLNLLEDNLNIPAYFSKLHALAGICHKAENAESWRESAQHLLATGKLIGLFNVQPKDWFQQIADGAESIEALVNARIEAKKAKNWPEADRIRKELAEQGIILEDKPDGTTEWRKA